MCVTICECVCVTICECDSVCVSRGECASACHLRALVSISLALVIKPYATLYLLPGLCHWVGYLCLWGLSKEFKGLPALIKASYN